MLTVTATEIKQKLGDCLESARDEPVVIENRGRPTFVILAIKEYKRLQTLEDAIWVLRAKEAEQEGFLGHEESTHRLMERLNAIKAEH